MCTCVAVGDLGLSGESFGISVEKAEESKEELASHQLDLQSLMQDQPPPSIYTGGTTLVSTPSLFNSFLCASVHLSC